MFSSRDSCSARWPGDRAPSASTATLIQVRQELVDISRGSLAELGLETGSRRCAFRRQEGISSKVEDSSYRLTVHRGLRALFAWVSSSHRPVTGRVLVPSLAARAVKAEPYPNQDITRGSSLGMTSVRLGKVVGGRTLSGVKREKRAYHAMFQVEMGQRSWSMVRCSGNDRATKSGSLGRHPFPRVSGRDCGGQRAVHRVGPGGVSAMSLVEGRGGNAKRQSACPNHPYREVAFKGSALHHLQVARVLRSGRVPVRASPVCEVLSRSSR